MESSLMTYHGISCVSKRRRRQWPETGTTTAESSSADEKTLTDTSSLSSSVSSSISSGGEEEAAAGSDYGREWRSRQLRSCVPEAAFPWSASRASVPRVCRVVGYLAGLAGGEIRVLSDPPPDTQSRLRRRLRVAVLNWSVCVSLNVVFMFCSVVASVLLLPLVVFDCVRCQVFWVRSLDASYAAYQRRRRGRRASLFALPVSPTQLPCSASAVSTADATASPASSTATDFDCDADRWQRQPWKCGHPLSEAAFVTFFFLRHFITHLSLTQWRSELANFRNHLTLHPPLFPVRSNDEVFRFDKPRGRFNLSMLFVVDRLEFQQVCDAFGERLIAWEPKMSSVITEQWGRACFKPAANFDLADHIKERDIDLSRESVASVMSDFGSEEFDLHKPLWGVQVLQPVGSAPRDADFEDANFLPSDRDSAQLTYILAKWSHVYADGVGTMATIVKRLGDYSVDMSGLPDKYIQEPPAWLVFLFWGLHGLLAALQGLRLFLFMSYGLAPYPALVQTSSQLKLPLPNTGRKWYSTPATFWLSEINVLRGVIASRFGTRPTVNDVFAHCVAASAGRLRSAFEVESYLRHHLGLPIRPTLSHPRPQLAAPGSLRHNCLQSIIPMMCRTSVPSHMDNFTSLVCSRLPLPKHCWSSAKEFSKGCLVQELLRVKGEIDFLKRQRLRTTAFLVMTCLFKALPLRWAQALYNCAYRSMQLCSTNVAAPGIESKFFGKEVHGLYFWPAVPATGTLGTSLVSLGNRVQFLTIIEECELQPGLALAERVFACEGLPFGPKERHHTLSVLAECWRRMVTEEYTKLKSLLLHPDQEEQHT